MTSRPPTGVPEPTRLFVWVWLPRETDPVVAGQIVDQGESMDFVYGRSYLARDNAIPLYEPELPLRSGPIAPEPPLRYANALRDAAPDAWGRRVIVNRLTGATGQAADDVMPDLGELTFLLQSGSDRTGALDFQESPADYVARDSETASLDTLVRAAEMVDRGILLEPVLAEALQHGTAIGGARPKALIEDGDRKYVAKFSSSTDTYNVVKAEYVAMRLAAMAGLDVAPVKLVRAMGRDVLLIERFDRRKTEGGWTRRAMVSALTLFGLDAIMAAHASYEDLTDIIRARFTRPRDTLTELFGRLVCNILVGNSDDHARNHAAFWDGAYLTLTPAYDICPQSRTGHEASQAMLIHGRERRSQLSACLASCAKYHLSREEALQIVSRQIGVVRTRFESVCDEAALGDVDRRLLWRRQFLNRLAFEGIESEIETAIDGLGGG